MRRYLVVLVKPFLLFLLCAVLFGGLHIIELFINLDWLVDFITKNSTPTLNKAPYFMYASISVLFLLIAKGKRRHVRDSIIIKNLRIFGRWLGQSSYYIICASSGLLTGIGITDKLHTDTLNMKYLTTGLVGLYIGLFLSLFVQKISDDLRLMVGELDHPERKWVAVAGVAFSIFVAVMLLFEIWSKSKI